MQEIKTFSKPPPAIGVILTGLLVIIGEPPIMKPVPGSFGKKKEDYFLLLD